MTPPDNKRNRIVMNCNPFRAAVGAVVASMLWIGALADCGSGHSAGPASAGSATSIAKTVPSPSSTSSPTSSTSRALPKSVRTTVVRITDGDTVVVRPVPDVLQPTNDAGTQHTVRLLGIDTAEMNYGKPMGPECGAQAANDRLDKLLPEGTTVTLVFDANADRTDRHGRSLAYIELADGTDVNRTQLAGGYAEAWNPGSAPRPERWYDYVSVAEQAKWAKKGAYGPPSKCASIGRPQN